MKSIHIFLFGQRKGKILLTPLAKKKKELHEKIYLLLSRYFEK